MSKRKSTDTNNSRNKRSKNVEYEYEEENFEDHNDIVILPNPDDSGEEDENDNEETEESFCQNRDKINNFAYLKAMQNYTPTQKKLEPEHKYIWQKGEKKCSGDINNNILLSDKMKTEIKNSSPVQLFEYFFDRELKQYIIDATRENQQEINMTDLEVFVGILLLTAFNTRNDQRDFWSKDEDLQCVGIIKAMSRNKFLQIKSKIKYAKVSEKNESDRAWRVRPMINIMRKNCQQFGFFATALSIDEMMIKFFGRTVLKQFIPSKPTRFGLKFWAICTSFGFLLDFDVYCGRNCAAFDENLSNIALGSKVVMQMVNSLLLKTPKTKLSLYHLYFDNYFTSPDLVLHLQKHGLRSTGVVRKDRIKEDQNVDKKAKRGEHEVSHEVNSGLNFITVMDSKQISLLSTATGVSPLTSMQRYSKNEHKKTECTFPHAVTLYNHFMGGVDTHDFRCNKAMPSIRSKKWTWVVFIRMIQTAVVNANVLHNLCCDKGKELTSKEFCLSVSKHYRSKLGDLSTHKSTTEPRANCSQQNCILRTTKMCIECSKYYCLSCFSKVHKKQ